MSSALPPMLDPASGSRMFYFDKQDERVLFGDNRAEEHVLCDERSLSIAPSSLMDFRALPFADETFYLVVFDPPHLLRAGDASWMAKKYGRLTRDSWREDLRAGFAECFRVLRPHGVLIFKWNETQIPVSKVLALTTERPILGHRSGKTARTHWVTFMKGAAS